MRFGVDRARGLDTGWNPSKSNYLGTVSLLSSDDVAKYGNIVTVWGGRSLLYQGEVATNIKPVTGTLRVAMCNMKYMSGWFDHVTPPCKFKF